MDRRRKCFRKVARKGALHYGNPKSRILQGLGLRLHQCQVILESSPRGIRKPRLGLLLCNLHPQSGASFIIVISINTQMSTMTDLYRFAYDALSNRYTSQQSGPASGQHYPHSRQMSINSTSRFSFASTVASTKQNTGDPTEPSDFLPTVNFDDLQTSITRDEPGFNHFPVSGSGRRVLSGNNNDRTDEDYVMFKRSPCKATQGSSPDRQGSLRRQNSAAGRGSHSSGYGDVMGPPSAPMNIQSRRQTYFPTPTGNISVHRSPRKSVGPGTLPLEFSEQAVRKRIPTHMPTDTDSFNYTTVNTGGDAGETFLTGDLSGPVDESSISKNGRSTKSKSLLPPPKFIQDNVSTPSGTPDQTISSFARSPARSAGHSSGTPSSDKRLSMMPNSMHATGLAARTVSPTDTRRMKRMSMMPTVPPIPYTPPTPQPDTPTSISRNAPLSPSLVPRKSVTPSSSRTTPDPNRKSNSSGISNSSSTSYNSTLNLSSAVRLSQSFSTSRLPTLRTRIDNPTLGGEEEVPPVPAIPKAYESPKTEYDQPYFSVRKSSLPFETGSTTSGSTAEGTPSSSVENGVSKPNIERPRGRTVDECPGTEKRPNATSNMNRRTLQPLRLPPLNLLPLSTPTAAKIAALYDGAGSMKLGAVTPPPKFAPSAIPSTPMTASKASFSRSFHDEDLPPVMPKLRSRSSHHTTRPESSANGPDDISYTRSPKTSDQVPGHSSRKAISPFISSSLPKTSSEFRYLGQNVVPQSNSVDPRQTRLTGPRLQRPAREVKDDASSQEHSSPAEASGSGFGNSLRRKLSLTRKRSNSKSLSRTDVHADTDIPPKPPKHDNMPPPKLPASATWHGPLLPGPSPTTKASSLESKARPSNSSITNEHQQLRSNTWTANNNTKKEPASAGSAAAVASKRTARAALEGSTTQNTLSLKDFLNEAKEMQLDRDDLSAEEEMRRLAARRKDTESAAKEYDALRRRATAKDRVGPSQALRVANLNIFERGEIVDHKDVYFCGTQDAKKHVGDLNAEAGNFGYDDERGDYNIVPGDHLAYRYEVVDILGKGSFGQVARCIDHKTGALVAIKIIRNKKRFHQQALVEVDILQKLRDWVSGTQTISSALTD